MATGKPPGNPPIGRSRRSAPAPGKPPGGTPAPGGDIMNNPPAPKSTGKSRRGK